MSRRASAFRQERSSVGFWKSALTSAGSMKLSYRFSASASLAFASTLLRACLVLRWVWSASSSSSASPALARSAAFFRSRCTSASRSRAS